jgi:hypothetical protein
VSAVDAISTVIAGLDVSAVRAAVAAFLVLAVVPAALRERGGGERQRDREKSKELCHTDSAWLTNFPEVAMSSLVALPELGSW